MGVLLPPTGPVEPAHPDVLVDAVAAAICAARDDTPVFTDARFAGSHWDSTRDRYRADARAALAAVAAAGRLSPDGSTTE